MSEVTYSNNCKKIFEAANNKSLCDVILIGNDGGRVPAVKFLLAAQSKVFERMLYGTFIEATSKEIELDFTSASLRAVYEFCLPGSPAIQLDQCQSHELLEIISALDFFEISPVLDKIIDGIVSLLAEQPQRACGIYNMTSSTEKVHSRAFDVICAHPEESLLPHTDESSNSNGGVECLSSAKVSDLIAKMETKVPEIIKFRVIEKWASAHNREIAALGDDESGEDKLGFAKTLIDGIDFSRMRSSDIVDYVQNSKLVQVPSGPLWNVLTQRAIEAEKSGYAVADDEHRKYSNKRSRVVVEEAGLTCVNGIYVEDGSHEGKPVFSRCGKYKSTERKFFLYYSEFRSCWVIVTCSDPCYSGPFNSDWKRTDLWWLYCQSSSCEEIESGWSLCLSLGGDDFPAPSVRYEGL